MYYRFYLSIKDGKRAAIRETGPNDSLAIAWAIGMVFFSFFLFPTLFQVLFGLFLLFTFFTFLFAGLHLGAFFYSPKKVSYNSSSTKYCKDDQIL